MRAIGLLRLVDAHLSMLSRKVSRIDVSQTVVYLVMWRRTAFYFGDTRFTSDAALVFLSLGGVILYQGSAVACGYVAHTFCV